MLIRVMPGKAGWEKGPGKDGAEEKGYGGTRGELTMFSLYSTLGRSGKTNCQ
jgi:hypothetical protein